VACNIAAVVAAGLDSRLEAEAFACKLAAGVDRLLIDLI